MKRFFSENKQKITAFLSYHLDERLKSYCDVNRAICEVIGRIKDYSINGKMIRGGLVALGYKLFSKNNSLSDEDLISAASAMEILHSSLLIHDDIMDRDEFRRGKESMHKQYFDLAKIEKMNDKEHFGESMAICAGDIGFFLCIELISKINKFDKQMMSYFSREVVGVGMAQMQDVLFTHMSRNPSESEIIEMYRHKTARYTFSMPLALGAMLAEASKEQIEQLELIGENLGIVFQIKDDELGLFGDEAVIGKPVFSDIKEGKKTIFNVALQEALNNNNNNNSNSYKSYFDKKLGSHYISSSEIQKIRKLFEGSGVKDQIKNKMQQYGANAKRQIDKLQCNEEHKQILLQLLDYSINREK